MKKEYFKALLHSAILFALLMFFANKCVAQQYSFGNYAFADSAALSVKLPSGTKAKFAYTIDDSGLWFWDAFAIEWKRIAKLSDVSGGGGGSDNISFAITDGGDSLAITDGAGTLKVSAADLANDQNIMGSGWNAGTGDLTIDIENGTGEVVNLDGRYLQAEVDGDITNEIQVLEYECGEVRLMLGASGDTINVPIKNVDYLNDYYIRDFANAGSIAAEIYGVGVSENFRPRHVYFNGKHERVYFVLEYLNPNRSAKIFWYDVRNNVFSDTAYAIGTAAPSTDTHNGYSITVSNDGVIILVGSTDDGSPRIFVSDYAEFDNAGTIDVSMTQSASATALTSYSNYVQPVWIGEERDTLVICWRGEVNVTTQEDRAISYSVDNGNTWSTPLHIMDVTENNWLYGDIFPDDWHNGFFYFIRGLRDDAIDNYPYIGVLWSRDLTNWGNLDFYASGGKVGQGWSKDVVTNGAITNTEMLNNLSVFDGYGTNKMWGRPKLNQCENGDVILSTREGFRSGGTFWDYVTTFRYDYYNGVLDTIRADFSLDIEDGTSIEGGSSWFTFSPFDIDNMRMWGIRSDGSLGTWKTCDGGASWKVEEEGILPSVSVISDGSVEHSPHGYKYFAMRNGDDVSIIREGESNLKSLSSRQEKNNPYNGNMREYAEVWVNDADPDTISLSVVDTPVAIADATTGEISGNFSVSAGGRITYNGGKTIRVHLSVTATISYSSNNVNITGHVYENGSAIDKGRYKRKVGTGSDVGNFGTNMILELQDGDFIDCLFSADVIGTLYVDGINVSILEI